MINNNIHTNISWNVIHSMFKENPNLFVEHHISSFNTFFSNNIKNIFKDNNHSILHKQYNDKNNDYNLKSHMYFGGKISQKFIMENQQFAIMMTILIFSNEARLKIKHGFNIYYESVLFFKFTTR